MQALETTSEGEKGGRGGPSIRILCASYESNLPFFSLEGLDSPQCGLSSVDSSEIFQTCVKHCCPKQVLQDHFEYIFWPMSKTTHQPVLPVVHVIYVPIKS